MRRREKPILFPLNTMPVQYSRYGQAASSCRGGGCGGASASSKYKLAQPDRAMMGARRSVRKPNRIMILIMYRTAARRTTPGVEYAEPRSAGTRYRGGAVHRAGDGKLIALCQRRGRSNPRNGDLRGAAGAAFSPIRRPILHGSPRDSSLPSSGSRFTLTPQCPRGDIIAPNARRRMAGEVRSRRLTAA